MWYEKIKWLFIYEIAYILVVFTVCIRIIIDTRSVTKALGYLLLVIFIPVVGIIFYFSVGINYRKRKIYNKKLRFDDELKTELQEQLPRLLTLLEAPSNPSLQNNLELAKLIANPKTQFSPVFPQNEIKIFHNGENLFPVLLEALRQAKDHIHMEYYIFENDSIGQAIEQILIKKAKEGVFVRFIYDDFGSKGIRKNIVKNLQENGVRVFPFNQIRLIRLANKLNYRNHRKIVVIDGHTAFTGGINICQKYDNRFPNKVYWRDTHLMVNGPAAWGLQQVFISDWNFCSNEDLSISKKFFPNVPSSTHHAFMQVVSSGPDSDRPNILFSLIQAINLAKKEILLTTPYYIPDTSLQDALIIASLSGVEVKLLVPEKGDSWIVNRVGQSYYSELLKAGVRIYKYKKGFVHAKTFVTDSQLASVGTANLDLRSFDLNFEVSTLIYDDTIATELRTQFYKDLEHSEEYTFEKWEARPKWRKMSEKVLRLISPLM